MRLVAAALGAAALASLVTACAVGGAGDVRAELRVFAAASLTEAFTSLADDFESRSRQVDVVLTFAGSSALANQIVDGAPADVFAAADEETMARLVDVGAVDDPIVIARNRATLLVEAGNPLGITALADVADPGVVLVLCAPEVPCGRVAAAALRAAGVGVTPASLEENVKAVVSKVALGEADAGIVYETDARAAGDRTDRVAIDGVDDPLLEAAYPMAVVTRTEQRTVAEEWMAFVASGHGTDVLRRFGFRSA